jgi:hypothetical protein
LCVVLEKYDTPTFENDTIFKYLFAKIRLFVQNTRLSVISTHTSVNSARRV